MRYSQYKFKFYLNASHSIYINGVLGEKHPHTWEIMIQVLKDNVGFIEFGKLEKEMENWMGRFQDQILNEVAPFDKINPTLENCCEYFKEEFIPILGDLGWKLVLIEMSETPTRSYVIKLFDKYDDFDKNREDSDVIASNILNDILNR